MADNGKIGEQFIVIGQLFLVILAGMMVGKLLSTWLRESFRIPICCGPMPPEAQQ
jgi:hypothetical protein